MPSVRLSGSDGQTIVNQVYSRGLDPLIEPQGYFLIDGGNRLLISLLSTTPKFIHQATLVQQR